MWILRLIFSIKSLSPVHHRLFREYRKSNLPYLDLRGMSNSGESRKRQSGDPVIRCIVVAMEAVMVEEETEGTEAQYCRHHPRPPRHPGPTLC